MSFSIVTALTIWGCTAGDTTQSTTGEPVVTTVASTRPTFDMANFSMDQVINGPSLLWSNRLSLESARAHGLVQLENEWFLFTSLDMSVNGLTAWSSTDGSTWREIGEVIPPGPDVGAIDVIGNSIIIATEGDADSPARIWLSENGTDWVDEAIPFEGENRFMAFAPRAIGGEDELLVIVGQSQVRAGSFIESRVHAVFGTEYTVSQFGHTVARADDDVEITLLGPLGFSMLTTSASQLGIEDPERSWLTEESDGSSAQVWLRYGPDDWLPASIPDAAEITAVSTTPDGGLLAVGFSDNQQTVLWESFDGSTWVQIPFDVRPHTLDRWNDLLIGPSSVGSHDLVVSQNGYEWTATGLADHLPPSLAWDFHAIGHNSKDLASIVEAWDFQSRTEPTLQFPTIERNGFMVTVEANRQGGAINVFEDPGSRAGGEGNEAFSELWHPRSASDRERVVIDAAAQTLKLLRDDGSEVITLTFDELEGLLDEEFRFIQSFSIRHRGIAISQDGSSWSISNLADIDQNRDVVDVGVADSAVFLITADHFDGVGVEVWTAVLP